MTAGAASSQTISLRGEPPAFVVEGSGILPRINNPNFEAIFRVTVDQPNAPPLSGNYEMKSGKLWFTPRYKMEPGLTYKANFRMLNESATGTFTIPKPPAQPAAFVEHVYPSASVLPENQLKFYIHFSAPMSRGESSRRIHLIEDGGKEVALPFLQLDEELWDRDQRRLTILFDPGRVKRDVLPNREVGPPLVAGRKYALVVDRDWKDAKGVPLKEPYRKAFTVSAAERSPIDPKTWKLVPPAADTSGPMVVDFPRPLDAALLLRFIDIADAGGKLVKGKITLDAEEKRWLFTPAQPWAAGKYSLEIVATLEDLAGNKIGRAFDVDRFDRVEQRSVSETHSLPFVVSAR